MRALDVNRSTKMKQMLQAKTRTELSKNGLGIEYRVERYHPVDTYPSRELKPASLSSVNRGEVREKEGVRGDLSPGSDGNGGGVR